MPIKALIFDLDNTLYPVASIGDELFQPLFQLLEQKLPDKGKMGEIKKDVMRFPFQKVAERYEIDKNVLDEGLKILNRLEYGKKIAPFEDFKLVEELPHRKFLVTMGFEKMQQSKVNQMELDKIFEEIYIVDPQHTEKIKRDIFQEIINKHSLGLDEVAVIGDDAESEIKAADEMGIKGILYDKVNFNSDFKGIRIVDYKDLTKFLE